MAVKKEILESIKKYIAENFVAETTILFNACFKNEVKVVDCGSSEIDSLLSKYKEKIIQKIDSSWQQSLFSYIDSKSLKDSQVYKRAAITKQTFSKIRSNKDYHPDKDTAIRLCIGLQLNLDDTLDLLSKAGYTLSNSIERDLVVKYFIEHNSYDIYEIDCVLEELKLKQFLKY